MVDSGAITGALISSGGSGGLMEINPGVIFWTLIIFVVLLVVLGKFAWKPILEALRKREERIRESLEKADRVAAEAEKAMAEQKAELEKHRQEMKEMMKREQETAERTVKERLEKASREADEKLALASRQIEDERNRAIEQIRTEAVNLALAAASHLLKKSLDSDDHKRIVSEYLRDLPTNLERH